VKTLLGVLSVLLLCSCAAMPNMRTSFNGNTYSSGPTSIDDPRLRSPQFYMNDDGQPVERAELPQPFQFHAIDGFCVASCQASHRSPEYCGRACGS
jgi:hypothetical protein